MLAVCEPYTKEAFDKFFNSILSGRNVYDGNGMFWYGITSKGHVIGEDRYGHKVFLTKDGRLGYYNDNKIWK